VDTLSKISTKYKCDKSDKNHNYTEIYDRIFLPYRHLKFNLLEFGFGEGRSVKMWLDYFVNATIINIDNMTELPKNFKVKNERFKFISADQIDIPKIRSEVKKYSPFFIIIDDASHVPEDQQYTLGHLFDLVQPDGWYVIEDLKCKRNHSTRLPLADKTLEVYNDYFYTKKFDSKTLDSEKNDYLTRNIVRIEVYDKISFIKKKG
jgi:hypothetical protein